MTFYRRAVGPRFNEGARLLWAALASKGDSIRAIETKAGASVGSSTKWLYGDVKPMTAARFEIQKIWGVPAEAWDQEPTEAFVPPALRETEPDAPELAHGDLPARGA